MARFVKAISIHLIGRLQRGDIKTAVSLFHTIHTLDRENLAVGLAKARDNGHPLPRLLIQVNVGEEPQKGGILPLDAPAFIARCKNALGLPVVGLMAIPPASVPPEPYFALLYQLAKEHDLTELSMGMSSDWQTAVRFGATHIRLGTAVFGERS
jgi:PLP dependent protein